MRLSRRLQQMFDETTGAGLRAEEGGVAEMEESLCRCSYFVTCLVDK